MVFPTFFNFSLNLAIRSSWSEPQSAPGLVFADCIELFHLWLQICMYIYTYAYKFLKRFQHARMCSHSIMSYSCNSMDCSPPGSSVYGTFQARILEWAAISFSRYLISYIGRQILYHCATWKVPQRFQRSSLFGFHYLETLI